MNAFKKNNFNTVLIVVLIIVNLASLYFMFNKAGFGHSSSIRKHVKHRSERSTNFMKKKLKLNDDQVAEFRKLKRGHHQKTKSLHDKMRMLHDELYATIGSDNIDVEVLTDSIGMNQKKIELLTYQHFIEMRALCNDDQKQLFDSVIKDLVRSMGPPKRGGPPK